jgi:hypothetical protein
MPVVTAVPIPRCLSAASGSTRLPTALSAVLSLALLGVGRSGSPNPAAASPELIDRVWQGVRQAEQVQRTGCGTLAETRVSPLLARPLVLRGRFCAAGVERFLVEYGRPEATRVVYNGGTLNVSTDGGKRTEVLDVSGAVRRAQRYFSGPGSSGNLERDFKVTVAEKDDRYALVLLPVSGRIAGRVKRVAVELGKRDFLPRRIEIDGKSGVDSVFEIEIDRLNEPLDERVFRVIRP